MLFVGYSDLFVCSAKFVRFGRKLVPQNLFFRVYVFVPCDVHFCSLVYGELFPIVWWVVFFVLKDLFQLFQKLSPTICFVVGCIFLVPCNVLFCCSLRYGDLFLCSERFIPIVSEVSSTIFLFPVVFLLFSVMFSFAP